MVSYCLMAFKNTHYYLEQTVTLAYLDVEYVHYESMFIIVQGPDLNLGSLNLPPALSPK